MTSEIREQTLIMTFITYEDFAITAHISSFQNLNIKLRESVVSLDAVTITAGTFEAGDKARVAVLKPLDIVTTAGTAGNTVIVKNNYIHNFSYTN